MLLFVGVLVAGTAHDAEAQRGRTRGKKVRGEPFEQRRYRSNNRYFRAVGNARSSRLDIAKKKAETDAKARLAGLINTTVKQVNEDFVQDISTENSEQFMQKFTSLTRTIVNQTLYNIEVMDSEEFRIKGRRGEEDVYNAYVAIQINKDEFLEALNREVAKDEELALNYNKEKYEEIFNEEMDRLNNEMNEEYGEEEGR